MSIWPRQGELAAAREPPCPCRRGQSSGMNGAAIGVKPVSRFVVVDQLRSEKSGTVIRSARADERVLG